MTTYLLRRYRGYRRLVGLLAVRVATPVLPSRHFALDQPTTPRAWPSRAVLLSLLAVAGCRTHWRRC